MHVCQAVRSGMRRGGLYILSCDWWWKGLLCGEDQSHDETVEAQHLREDEDQDHAHEQSWLLGSAPNTSIPHDANGKASSQATQPHTQASTQLKKTPGGRRDTSCQQSVCPQENDALHLAGQALHSPVEGDAISQGVGDKYCHHQAVDGDDPSHNHWDDRLHDQLWPHD